MKPNEAALRMWLRFTESELQPVYKDDFITRFYNESRPRLMGIRNPYVCANGRTASIQQSITHYCTNDSAEVWNCKPHSMLEPYGDGPYAYVPLSVVADYIDWLNSLPPEPDHVATD